MKQAVARLWQGHSGKPTAGLDWRGRNGFHRADRAAARRARMIMHDRVGV